MFNLVNILCKTRVEVLLTMCIFRGTNTAYSQPKTNMQNKIHTQGTIYPHSSTRFYTALFTLLLTKLYTDYTLPIKTIKNINRLFILSTEHQS